MNKLIKYGAGACTLCDLSSRSGCSEHVCVSDYFPKNLNHYDIMIVLGNLPDDYTDDLGDSEQVQSLISLVEDIHPNKTIGVTSAIKCSVSPKYIKQASVNKCCDHYFRQVMQNRRADRYIIMGAKACGKIAKKAASKGKLYDFKYGKFVATDLLYLVLESDHSKKEFQKQIKPLYEQKRDLKGQFDIRIVKSAFEIKEAYKQIKDAPFMMVDIEASSLPYRRSNVGHRVLCVSFTIADNQAFVFPLDSASNAYEENAVDAAPVLSLAWFAVEKILTNEARKCFHNGKYDVLYFDFAKGIKVQNFCEDTMLISYLLDERGSHGLKELTNQLIPEMIAYDDELDDFIAQHKNCNPKKGGSYYYIPNRILFPYCGLDTIATWKLYHLLKPQLLKNEKQTWVYNHIMIPVTKTYMAIEKRGIRVDRKGLQAEGRRLQQIMNEAQSNVIKYCIEHQVKASRNLDSTRDVAALLLDLGEVTKDQLTYSDLQRCYSIDDKIIAQLINKGSQVCKWISTFRKKGKLKGTYVDSALAKCDEFDRIHANFLIHTTDTGRSAARDPNLQNQPPYIRKFFIAPKGKIKFEFDYSQLELRLMACMSKDPIMCRMYHPEIDKDLHAFTAAGSKKVIPMAEVRAMIMAGKIDELIEKVLGAYESKFENTLKKRFRRQAKSTNFHMIFGGMVDSLQKRINQDMDKNIRELFMEIDAFPDKEELLLPQIADLKEAKISIKCNDCGNSSYEPFRMDFNKKQGKRLHKCPRCGSYDIENEAKDFYDGYFEMYTEVKPYHDWIEAFLREHGYVETVFGRRKHLPEIWSDNRMEQIEAANAAKNSPIQSPGADLKFQSLIKAERMIPKNGLKETFIDCEVHDSITGESTYNEMLKTYDVVRYSMECWNNKFDWLIVPLKADCKIGFNWGKMTEIKDRNHLQQWLEENKSLLTV